MSTFVHPLEVADLATENNAPEAGATKRPSRWSPSNWPGKWKVVAIALVPTALAVAFGGMRIYTSATEAADFRLAADRAEMIQPIDSYMSALDGVLSAPFSGRDLPSALRDFDGQQSRLQQELGATDVTPDVRSAITTVLDDGQDLRDRIASNEPGVRQHVLEYAPILLAAEDAVNGSVLVESETLRQQARGLSDAIGARGQMLMQQMCVNLGGELPEPELRTSMITLAGTEPPTLDGIGQVLGAGSPEMATMREQMVNRMAILSDPDSVLVGNPAILESLQTTDDIVGRVVTDTIESITTSVQDQAAAARTAAIRDSVIVLAAIALAVLIGYFMALALVRPLRVLRDSALRIAHKDLDQEIAQLRAGGEPSSIDQIPVHTSDEIGQVAHAVDELHEQALLLAGEQARLQLQVGDMFETLSRRNRSLVDQQLSLIDRLERDEEDPDRLDSLFRLDHLAARMRRNGANLLVLAGSEIPREQSEPVSVAAIINAAASEVEDYRRVVTAEVPDSALVGSAAGDLVHLLAELLDNALRYSPPTAQVRVSGVHTGNGGLVIEVSDIGLGMSEGDLRVANTRLESGGQVDPYTARHMGLFVVGRLAEQHGLVVRLRSSIAGEPNSGTTAGAYVPTELIARRPVRDQFGPHGFDDGAPPQERSGIALDRASAFAETSDTTSSGEQYDLSRNGSLAGSPHADLDVTALPRRNPGASGIADVPDSLVRAADSQDQPKPAEPDPWVQAADQQGPLQRDPREDRAVPEGRSEATREAIRPVDTPPTKTPADTSAYFASRGQVAGNGGTNPPPAVAQPSAEASAPEPDVNHDVPRHAASSANSSQQPASEDAIYQRMLSEWLIDPTTLDDSDLQWQSVWDNGWSAAAHAADAPVDARTEHGLPVREPGARLVPGAIESGEPGAGVPGATGHRNGGNRNGGAHRNRDDDDDQVASAGGFDADQGSVPVRDPEAIRASISNHFGGVRAGRSHAREPRGSDTE